MNRKNSILKYNQSEKGRATQKRANRTEASIQRRKEYLKRKYVEARLYIDNVRKNSVCAFCGEKRWQVLEFHHIDPSSKSFQLSDMYIKNIQKIQEEIEKCLVICANCHRMLEWEKRNSSQ